MTTWFDIARGLLNEVEIELGDTIGGTPPRSCVLAGEVVWDECCEAGGQLWVRITRVYPASDFPLQDVDASNCWGAYAADLEVGILRCAPTDEPTCEDLELSAHQTYEEGNVLRRAVLCYLRGLTRDYTSGIENVLIGELTVLGPEGGCIGSLLVATIGLDDCHCE